MTTKMLVVGVMLALVGCRAMEQEQAKSTEELLAAAGFHMKLADTPERMAHLRTLPQRKLETYDQNGEIRYVYADAEGCKCLYAGDEAEYDAYEKLAAQQRAATEQLEASEMDMDWGMWGPWPYW